ncbi:tyrosine-type recombinase/integrase [Caldifermentibacillus hisashii]|uniref:tyrosine-type recombinase/integrase n=1 Tax=Caldifermentibacillus hisashii TaxID=996558 RepID=UPI0031FC0F19
MRKNRIEIEDFRSFSDTAKVKTVNFDQATEDFYDDRRRSGTRESTIEYYRRELTLFRRYIVREKDTIIPVSEINVELLNGFIDYLRNERGNSVGGINAKIRAVRTFMFYCEEVGYIKHNPARDWKQIKRKEPEINAFTMQQITALLKQPDLRKFTGLRDYTLMLTLLDTGARISEALGIKVDDVLFNENRIFLRNTKTNLNRYVPISEQLKSVLKQYLQIHNGMSEFVFVNLSGKPIDKNSFRLIVHGYGKKAGIKGVRCSPHTFRHTFAKFYILNGGDAFSLMQIMGHTTMEMTKRYIRLFSTDIIEKHKKYSPLKYL